MKNNILKITVVITILSFISKIIGLGRDALIASTFGATYVTDAYNIALTIPNILYMICASAIMITFIPNFIEVEENEGISKAYDFANKFITILLIISILFYIISIYNVDKLVNIISPNLSSEAFLLTINLTKITLINLISTVLTSVYSSILRSKNKYIGNSIMPIVANIPIILFLLFNSSSNNIIIMTIISTLGFILQVIILIPELKSVDYKYKFNIYGFNERIIDIFRKVVPIMLGLAISQVSIIVDKNIGSSLGEGIITSLELSSKLISVIYGVLTTTIITVFTPILAKQYINDDKTEWLNSITNILNYLLLIIIPLIFGAFILNENIISILYERGNFTQENVLLVSIAFCGYLVQVPFMGIRDVMAQAYYSTKDTKTPAINGSIAVIANIVLTIIFSNIWGAFGIAFATSISLVISSWLLVKSFVGRYKEFDIIRLKSNFLKIFLSSIIMLISIFFLKKCFNNDFIIIIICTIVGVIIQFTLYKLFNIKEVSQLLKIIKKNYQRNK